MSQLHVFTQPNAANLTAVERTGKPIWESLFATAIAYGDTVTPDYLMLHGMPTVGEAQFDVEMQQQYVDSYMTIDKMVEYFRRGITVVLRHRADTLPIFRIVTQYLTAWKNQIEDNINVGLAPYEDLMLLDRFAEHIFTYACGYFSSDYIASNFLNAIEKAPMITRESLEARFTRRTAATQTPRYDSLQAFFASRIIRKGDSHGN